MARSKNRSVVLIAGAVASAAWLILLYKPIAARPANAAAVDTPRDVPDDARKDGELSPATGAGESRPPRPAPPVAPTPLPGPSFTPEQLQKNTEMIAIQTELLEQEMREGERDEGAASAEKQLMTVYSKPEFGSGPVEVQCRKSLCKLSLGAGDTDEVRAEVQHMSLSAPWSAPGFMLTDSEQLRVTFYLAREGHKLPEVPPDVTAP